MTIRAQIWAACSAVAILLPAVAAAEPGAPPSDTWYGWQTLTADGASLAVIAAGAAIGAADGDGAAIATAVLAGGAGFVLATPIIHATHGRDGVGVASFAMRSGGMLVSMVTGVALTSGIACNASSTACEGELGSLDEAIVGAGVGLGVGALATTAIDAAALAWEPAPKTPTTTVRWAPTGGYDPRRELATVGVHGTF